MNDLRDDFSVFFELHEDSFGTDCPNCFLDIFDNTSTGVFFTGAASDFTGGFCPTCSGFGYINYRSGKTNVSGVINYLTPGSREFTELGIKEGIGFRLTTSADAYTDIVNARKIVVEDLDTQMVTIEKKGMKTWWSLEAIVRAENEGRSNVKIS